MYARVNGEEGSGMEAARLASQLRDDCNKSRRSFSRGRFRSIFSILDDRPFILTAGSQEHIYYS